jgi:two-component system, response regulator FlrC
MTDRKRILVVEDDRISQEIVVGLLAIAPAEALAVDSAEAALIVLARQKVDGIILDLALPGMDGLTMLRHLREREDTATVPIISYSAYHSSLLRQDALACGSTAYMGKPFNEYHFLELVRRVFGIT